MTFSPRKYQQDAITAALNHDNGIIAAPTGSGKSYIIAGIAKVSQEAVLVLQPTAEILKQNYEKYMLAGGKDAAIYSASLNQKQTAHVTFATIGSIIKRCEIIPEKSTIIIDECQLVNSKAGQYKDLIKSRFPKKLIGLTATPYRLHNNMEGSEIKLLCRTKPKLFGDIIYNIDSSLLVEQGFLLRPEYKINYSFPRHLMQSNSTGAEFSEQSIDYWYAKSKLSYQAAEAVKYAVTQDKKHVLVFASLLKYAEEIKEFLNQRQISAAIIDGKMNAKKRQTTLDLFKAGQIKVMINVGVLTTGFDFPALDCLVIARPTLSLNLWYQMVGRVVRPYPDKSPLVFDLCANHTQFGDPLNLKLVKIDGLWEILSEKGRVNNRNLSLCPEAKEQLHFGKYKGVTLEKLPYDYLEWANDNFQAGKAKRKLASELLRRNLYQHVEADAGF